MDFIENLKSKYSMQTQFNNHNCKLGTLTQ